MKLLVTGASSFVGAHFCQIASKLHDVYAVYFSTPIRLHHLTPIRADLRKERDLRVLRELDVDAVIHIATKIKATATPEFSPAEAGYQINRRMMEGVLSLQKPIVYASSTVVHWQSDSPYVKSRREDESDLITSGLPYAILRPSAPYGPKLANHHPAHKESFHTLVDWVRSSPVVPVIGSGKYRRQPIHVADFANSILSLLENELPNAVFEAGGADALAFNEIIDHIATALHKKARRLHLPKALFVAMAKWHPDFDPTLIRAIDEDEIADPTSLSKQTGIIPRSFSQGVTDLLS